MKKSNIFLCSLALCSCESYNSYNRNMIQGQVLEVVSVQNPTTTLNISSILPLNESRQSSLTLVLMESSCEQDYNLWVRENSNRISLTTLEEGVIIHKIARESSDEFVVVIDANQFFKWRIDIEKFNMRYSKSILFGAKSISFRTLLESAFLPGRVIIPDEGCNKN